MLRGTDLNVGEVNVEVVEGGRVMQVDAQLLPRDAKASGDGLTPLPQQRISSPTQQITLGACAADMRRIANAGRGADEGPSQAYC